MSNILVPNEREKKIALTARITNLQRAAWIVVSTTLILLAVWFGRMIG